MNLSAQLQIIVDRCNSAVEQAYKETTDTDCPFWNGYRDGCYRAFSNSSLNNISAPQNVKLIIVGDNPGASEKEAGQYMIGENTGKPFINFIKKSGIVHDFDTEAVILNKTPIWSENIAKLKKASASPLFKQVLDRSLLDMALMAFDVHSQASPGAMLLIVGYGGLKKEWKKAVFAQFFQKLRRLYSSSNPSNLPYLFPHFSGNHFYRNLCHTWADATPNSSIIEVMKLVGKRNTDTAWPHWDW